MQYKQEERTRINNFNTARNMTKNNTFAVLKLEHGEREQSAPAYGEAPGFCLFPPEPGPPHSTGASPEKLNQGEGVPRRHRFPSATKMREAPRARLWKRCKIETEKGAMGNDG